MRWYYTRADLHATCMHSTAQTEIIWMIQATEKHFLLRFRVTASSLSLFFWECQKFREEIMLVLFMSLDLFLYQHKNIFTNQLTILRNYSLVINLQHPKQFVVLKSSSWKYNLEISVSSFLARVHITCTYAEVWIVWLYLINGENTLRQI